MNLWKSRMMLMGILLGLMVPAIAQDSDIVDTAIDAGNFTTLVTAVQAAGLEDDLRGPGPFTVFAPTDAAFAALPDGTLDFLLDNPDELRTILLYHVVPGQVLAADVVNLDSAETLEGRSVQITVDEDGVMINEANVLATDVLASNGVIHVIDQVLLPPAAELNLIETAAAAGNFETLLTAVEAAGLTDALTGGADLTVFAPTDTAFAALPEGLLDELLADNQKLTSVLLYHAVAGRLLSGDVVAADTLTTLNGETIEITVMDDMVKVNNATITAVDVEASNGVIHVLDAVLIPPSLMEEEEKDIVDTAIDADDFSTLVTAVQAAGLEDALRGPGPFTVFAPTDAAFAALPSATLDALLNDPDALANVLLYHVVEGALAADDVVAVDALQTLQGENISITVGPDGVQINQANLIATDVNASNGVIHVIDQVLLPPEEEPLPDIVDTAISAGQFGTLVTAVQAAGLEEALRGEGPFTVFAPTDDAFAALPSETLQFLLDNPDTLAEVLLYHVVPGALGADQVLSANQLRTLQGSFAFVTVNDEGAFIENAKIVATDVEAGNGVIHVIDEVIIPPNLNGTTYEVSVTNLTKGQIFSPPLVVSHREDISLFELGTPASPGLKLLAEDGDPGVLVGEVGGLDAVYDLQVFDGVIAPGQTATATITTRGLFDKISVAGMLVVTNDAFFSTELEAPRALADLVKRRLDLVAETQSLAIAYDAGTEFNSENCADIPGPPCGNPGAAPADAGEGYIYVSNGIHGVGDLAPADYDWGGPVALIKVTRQ